MPAADRINLTVGKTLLQKLAKRTDRLNNDHGLTLHRTDLIRMGAAVLMKIFDEAIEGREIYTITDVEMAILDYIDHGERDRIGDKPQ